MINYKILAELDVSSINDLNILRKTIFTFFQRNRNEYFDPNERLNVVLGDHDLYSNNTYGVKLAIVQTACDEIDISRCYIQIITTNSNIKEEIETVAKNNNKFDHLGYQILAGTYNKIVISESEYQYSSYIPTKVKLEDLNKKETYWLTESKTFCMYPWIHLNASPNGDAMPCCLWDYNVPMGSVKENTIEELWNNDNWKMLRKDMMEDRPNAGCTTCYGQEESGFFSPRNSANKHHGHHIDRVSRTSKDGHSADFKMTYWDIRFSNLCNLSCRSCGHIFSSSWYKDQKELAGPEWAKKNKPLFWAGRHETDMYDQLLEHIDYVEQVYFAGGEPLMMEEHYRILEELERREKFDVGLVYNTNFTKT